MIKQMFVHLVQLFSGTNGTQHVVDTCHMCCIWFAHACLGHLCIHATCVASGLHMPASATFAYMSDVLHLVCICLPRPPSHTCQMCCTWFAHACLGHLRIHVRCVASGLHMPASATLAYMIETVHQHRAEIVANCTFHCDDYYNKFCVFLLFFFIHWTEMPVVAVLLSSSRLP